MVFLWEGGREKKGEIRKVAAKNEATAGLTCVEEKKLEVNRFRLHLGGLALLVRR